MIHIFGISGSWVLERVSKFFNSSIYISSNWCLALTKIYFTIEIGPLNDPIAEFVKILRYVYNVQWTGAQVVFYFHTYIYYILLRINSYHAEINKIKNYFNVTKNKCVVISSGMVNVVNAADLLIEHTKTLNKIDLI